MCYEVVCLPMSVSQMMCDGVYVSGSEQYAGRGA